MALIAIFVVIKNPVWPTAPVTGMSEKASPETLSLLVHELSQTPTYRNVQNWQQLEATAQYIYKKLLMKINFNTLSGHAYLQGCSAGAMTDISAKIKFQHFEP